jgi:mono/diheme cytochrome c family protein
MVTVRSTALLVAAALVATAGCKRSSAHEPPDGRELFRSNCGRCHGESGGGGAPLFAGGPSPRNFQEHDFHATHTDEQIRHTIVNGKGTGMPAFGKAFNDAQLAAIVAHVRSLDPQTKP